MVRNAGDIGDEDEQPTWAESTARIIIAGHERGAIRRIALYNVLGAALIGAIAFANDPIVSVLGVMGVIALLLLAMTDQLA